MIPEEVEEVQFFDSECTKKGFKIHNLKSLNSIPGLCCDSQPIHKYATMQHSVSFCTSKKPQINKLISAPKIAGIH